MMLLCIWYVHVRAQRRIVFSTGSEFCYYLSDHCCMNVSVDNRMPKSSTSVVCSSMMVSSSAFLRAWKSDEIEYLSPLARRPFLAGLPRGDGFPPQFPPWSYLNSSDFSLKLAKIGLNWTFYFRRSYQQIRNFNIGGWPPCPLISKGLAPALLDLSFF